MTIPRHLVDLTTLMTTLLIVSACIGPMNTDLCNNIASHFTGCNTVAFIMHHSAMRASALFVAAIAVSTSSAMQYKVVSSAYISIQVFSRVLITFGRSSVYRLNRKGPSTDPCGTPQVTGEVWDMRSPTVVN